MLRYIKKKEIIMKKEARERLNRFIKKNAPKNPILKHKEELLELHRLGFNKTQILEYVRVELEIKTTARTIKKFFDEIENVTVESVKKTEKKEDQIMTSSSFFENNNK